VKRILVVKLADLGDTLTATPGLRALRNAYPSARIGALVAPHALSVLRGLDTVDEIIPFDKFAFDRPAAATRSLPTALDLAGRLRGGRWDAVVLFHHLTTRFGTAKYAALCLASGAPVRAGLDNGRGWFLTHRERDEGFGSRHEVDHWLAVAATLGGWNEHPRLELKLAEEDRAWASRTLETLGRAGCETALIHPGAGGFSVARRWPPERFTTVADELDRRHGLRPLVLYGPSAGERELATTLAQGRHDVIGPAPSPQALVALLERARLFVGNDSGTLHLAAAAGTPTVAIFGPSNHLAWGPYPPGSAHHAIVREPLACSPCIYRGHALGTPQGCPARTCLDLVEPDQVLAAVEGVLAAGISSAGRPNADIVTAT
jgi:ADP-heptose:LPS heptosyltransferase